MPDEKGVSSISDVFSRPRAEYGDEYEEHLLQQYVLYVQMADHVSDRRSLANTFFLTANTIILSALGVITAIFPAQLIAGGVIAFIASVTPILLCYAWLRIVKSYQQLNSGKFAVIHEVEKKLPLALYKAEWAALGEGKHPETYKPLTDVEKWVPVTFMALYLIIAVAAFFRGV